MKKKSGKSHGASDKKGKTKKQPAGKKLTGKDLKKVSGGRDPEEFGLDRR